MSETTLFNNQNNLIDLMYPGDIEYSIVNTPAHNPFEQSISSEDNMINQASNAVGTIILKTLTQLVASGIRVAIQPSVPGDGAFVKIDLDDGSSAELHISESQMDELIDDPTSDISIAVLSKLAEDLDITTDDVVAAKELYAFREDMGLVY